MGILSGRGSVMKGSNLDLKEKQEHGGMAGKRRTGGCIYTMKEQQIVGVGERREFGQQRPATKTQKYIFGCGGRL